MSHSSHTSRRLKIVRHFGPKEPYPVVCLGLTDTLRVGVFFDGTGNSAGDSDTWSNVLKLYYAYINHYDSNQKTFTQDYELFEDPCAALYKRGVGTDTDGFIDKVDNIGSVTGAGIAARINGMVFDFRELLIAYKKAFCQYPAKVEFDIFGFSRGAATARHFANLVDQHHINLRLPDLNDSISYSINFLGIFDTVGSTGFPGNAYDSGLSLHVSANIKSVVHFIAEDEYRANFDLVSAVSNQDTEYPRANVKDGRIEEILMPGAHADVGGCYPSSLEHDVNNNELATIPLRQMYEKALKAGVAFYQPDVLDKNLHRNVKSSFAPQPIDALYRQLMSYYDRYPPLRRWYKQYRQVDLTLNAYDTLQSRQLSTGVLGTVASLFGENATRFDRKGLSYSRGLTFDSIEKLMGRHEMDNFLDVAVPFYQRYVHKSVFPWNTTTGMWAQPKSKWFVSGSGVHYTQHDLHIFHRDIHTPKRTRLWDTYGGVATAGLALEVLDYDKGVPLPFEDGQHGTPPDKEKIVKK